MIRLHDPLCFGTQEGMIGMLEELELHEYDWVGGGRRGGSEDEHCAIFYKKEELDVLEHRTFWLSEQPDVPSSKSWDSALPRICTWAHLRHRGTGREWAHFNTHLDHVGPQAKFNGISLIWRRMKEVRERKQLPVVLTGDFNSRPASPVIQLMRGLLPSEDGPVDMIDAYSTLTEPIGPSGNGGYSGKIEGEPIDYIFVTPDIQVASVQIDRRMIDGRYPSDHYPVVGHLRLS
jgi:endonuclease/exonuclease/phosphatase family metal-dependent hydrolase